MPNSMNIIKAGSLSLLALACITACGPQQTQQTETPAATQAAAVTVSSELWGKADNQDIYRFTLKNANGMQIQLINWGAYITSIMVPDRNGKFEDVVVGYDDFSGYHTDNGYMGPIVGRFGNRIDHGQFTIDGQKYQLTINDGENQLHGGMKGLHHHVWQAKQVENGVQLHYLSKDGEEGYPGNLDITVTYTLNNNNEMMISYEATTDKKTPVNLTSHVFYNLSGDMKSSIEGFELTIPADTITPVNSGLIPTGEFMPVEGTPFDFRTAKAIGKDIRVADEQLKKGGGTDKEFGGYDHNWVFSDWDGSMKHQVHVYDPVSGRTLDISTEEPGIQFYAGNFMDGTMKGKGGKPIPHRYVMALEPQHFPDSPNQPNFPNTILKPGETYKTASIYKFGVEK